MIARHAGLEVSFCRGIPGERVFEVRVEKRDGDVLVVRDNFTNGEAARRDVAQLANDPMAQVRVRRIWRWS